MLYGYYQALAVHVSLITYLLGPTAVAVGLMGKLSSWELVVWENPAVLCPQFLGLVSLMSGLASHQLVATEPPRLPSLGRKAPAQAHGHAAHHSLKASK